MRVVGILPARMQASRLPNKPLVRILGIPMVGHCFHRTCLALGRDNTYVATCDAEIADYVEGIGGKAVLTSFAHTRATTRSAEAAEKVESEEGGEIDIVVMVQADEPLLDPNDLIRVIKDFEDPDVNIVNLMRRATSLEEFENKDNVKVVVDSTGNALYYSREPIPSPWKGWEHLPKNIQTGIIAFRRGALADFNAMEETPLEQIESVDMNRVVETGGRIRMVATTRQMVSVDVEDEVEQVEELMRDDPIASMYRWRRDAFE